VRIVVDEKLTGLRLDTLLARQGVVSSVAAGRRVIQEGRVRVDGRRAKKGLRLQRGQVVELEPVAPGAPAGSAAIELAILYVDADLVAVDKPAGVPTHSLRSADERTVAGALAARYPECAAASPDPREGGVAHRLDTGTSGVLLAARYPEAWGRLRACLAAPDCEKVYLAEVVGRPCLFLPDDPTVEPRGDDGAIVTSPIGRVGRRGGRVRLGGGRQPLPARTEVRVVAERQGTTLVEARLSKGRSHQVRVHLAHLGAPVVGDGTYGPPTVGELRLHAAAVTFSHPTTGERMRIVAPLPRWAEHS